MHSLIVGQTESGKTTLAKILTIRLQKQGKKTAVLDPLLDSGWGKPNLHTDDPEELWAYLTKEREVFFAVDECGEVFNEGNDKTHSCLATRSRHFGDSGLFVCQRGMQLPKTMRDQCSKLYLFTSSRDDGKLHAEEWNNDTLAGCNKLARLHFYSVDRYTPAKALRIGDDYKSVQLVKGAKGVS